MKKGAILNLSLLLLLSLLFLFISIFSSKIQSKFIDDSTLFELFSSINSAIALMIPVTLFVFYIITSYLILQLFDFEGDLTKLTSPVLLSFTPIILYSFIYLELLFEINNVEFASATEILLHKNFFGLNLDLLNSVGIYFWSMFYIIYFFNLKKKLSISYGEAAATALFPTFLVLFLKLIL